MSEVIKVGMADLNVCKAPDAHHVRHRVSGHENETREAPGGAVPVWGTGCGVLRPGHLLWGHG